MVHSVPGSLTAEQVYLRTLRSHRSLPADARDLSTFGPLPLVKPILLQVQGQALFPEIELPRVHLVDVSGTEETSALAALLGATQIFAVASGALLGTMGTAFAETRSAQATNVREKGVVFVGMNEGSAHEVEALKKRTAVTAVFNGHKSDSIRVGRTDFDLASAEGRAGFVAALGLEGDRAAALVLLIESTGVNARDEMAQLAKIYRQVDLGERAIERMVLSGHSVGSGIWGDGNGSLSFSNLAKLSAIFPRAAAGVQHLIVAACYSGGQGTMDNFRAIFPNVKTIWAYSGSAPGSYSGAVPHLLRWEQGTKKGAGLDRAVVQGIRKGENVAVWTAERGYDNGQAPQELSSVREAYEQSKPLVAEFKSGAQVVANSQEGPLRNHYNHLQRLLGRADLPASERETLSTERDFVIRLLYWDNVRSFFQATHVRAIAAAYAELGLPAPDFSKMSRKEAVETVEKFQLAADHRVPARQSRTTRGHESIVADDRVPTGAIEYLRGVLQNGLIDLQPEHVPEAWL
jgi:hypothetical protein